MSKRKTKYIVAILAVVILAAALGTAAAQGQKEQPPARLEAPAGSTTSTVLQYQGRLTDPTSGDPVANGNYSMRFRLYPTAGGGPHLWEESKSVPVKDGLFSTILGDTAALAHSIFDGQKLWLGVQVGTDAEATPRQPVVPVAYALGLVPGAEVVADSGAPVLQVENVGSGYSIAAKGAASVDGDLDVSGNLIGGTHTHAMLPIAFGVVDTDGTLLAASNNVTSAWSAANNRYEITIDGEAYWYTYYVTLVTPICSNGSPAVGSYNSKLIVNFYDGSGAQVQCAFQFVTFEP